MQIIKPMLANTIEEKDLSKLNGYAYEPKFDGSRNIFIIDFEHNSLTIKRRNSRTNIFEQVADYQFPEFNINNLRNIFADGIKNIIIDGEMMSNDFASLMNRTQLTDKFKIGLAMRFNPVYFVVFDVLSLNDTDLTILPYSERRKTLEKAISSNEYVKVIDMFTDNPTQMFKSMLKGGFEGIIAKRLDSKYVQRRNDDWLKCKRHFTETLEILDYDTKSKSRPQTNKSHKVPVLNLITEKGRITVPLKSEQDYFYKNSPRYVEVEFQELSKQGKMRFPKFLRFLMVDEKIEAKADLMRKEKDVSLTLGYAKVRKTNKKV